MSLAPAPRVKVSEDGIPGRLLKLPRSIAPLCPQAAGHICCHYDPAATALAPLKPRRRPAPKRWCAEEDEALDALITAEGVPATTEEWNAIARRMPTKRSAKHCKFRWRDRLAPGLRRDAWTQEEDELLLSTQARLGNAWSSMVALFPGRSYPSVKNR